MFCFSRMSSILIVLFTVAACGPISRVAPEKRSKIDPIVELEDGLSPVTGFEEVWVDSLPQLQTACQWHRMLERSYRGSSARFRLLGEVEVLKQAPEQPKEKKVIRLLLSFVDVFLPWKWFREVDKPRLGGIVPWGRVDVKGHAVSSIAFLEGIEPELPNREEFIELARQALKKSGNHGQLVLFNMALKNGRFDVLAKRDEVVEEEVQKVFPGFFSSTANQDLTESLALILIQNGLRNVRPISQSDLEVYSKKLPVFRNSSWASFEQDMKWGLFAAIKGLRSRSARERACASNVVFRAADQMVHLMGQPTLPLLDLDSKQSYAPAISSIVNEGERPRLKQCRAAGSLMRNNMRVTVTEEVVENLGELTETYSWASQPVAMEHCRPESDGWASGYPAKRSRDLATMLSRSSAMGHLLFALNPNAPWWATKNSYPLGDFEGLGDIQKSRALAPVQVHQLGLGLMQLDVENFMQKHLLYIGEDGLRADAPEAAVGLRFAEMPIENSTEVVETKLSSTLRLLELVSQADRYLLSVENWRRSDRFSDDLLKKLFVSEETFEILLGNGPQSNRELIQEFYLGTSLLLMSFVDSNDRSQCFASLEMDLATGNEIGVGDCGEQRERLAKAMDKLGDRLGSKLLKRRAIGLLALKPN